MVNVEGQDLVRMLDLIAEPTRYKALGPIHIDDIARRYGLSTPLANAVRAHAHVLPFRVNDYVLGELIDWSSVPDDPIFQLVFPQEGMLAQQDVADVVAAERESPSALAAAVSRIRSALNPHPGGQRELNVPTVDGVAVPGVQHKYRETVLYFPSHGQSCHAYCTYCFRWAQFVGEPDQRFAAPNPAALIRYLRAHPEVTDVLVTGGDPLIMSAARLAEHVLPLLTVDSVRTIRLGTKSLAYWPHRFVTDNDADDVLRLMERVVDSGRVLAVMAHFSHPRELGGDTVRTALRRVRGTGATLYGQAPIMAHVNADAGTWDRLWRAEHALGIVPYYLFVARDTGPRDYFRVSLADAERIFRTAYRRLPGLARTVRGPVMSTTAGKLAVSTGMDGLRLEFVQAREPGLVGRPFDVSGPAGAAWLDELTVAPSAPRDIAAAVAPYTAPSAGTALPSRARVTASPNLAIDEHTHRLRAAGRRVLPLGFGEAQIPVPAEVEEQLRIGARQIGYGPVAGEAAVREAVAGYFDRRRLATDAEQIVLAPGSKPLLMALMSTLDGDVLLPRPCWLTYASHVRVADRRSYLVDVPPDCGGVPDPDALDSAVVAAHRAGGRPKVLILTLPDNPTGTIAPPELVRAVCAVAERHDLVVISDEIYRDMMHDPATPVLSPAELIPDRTLITTGLSKSLSLGGWRIGLARFPAGPAGQRLRTDVLALASEIWSALARPMQQVAGYVFGEPDVVTRHLRASARLHGAVANAVHDVVVKAGAITRLPTGAFYLYPDFEPVREPLRAKGITDAPSLESALLNRYGIAVLGGQHLGDDPAALRVRLATGMLYGDDDEARRAALHAADPLTLPHIATVVDDLATGLAALTEL